jgi:putative FmdB family regulatory protein
VKPFLTIPYEILGKKFWRPGILIIIEKVNPSQEFQFMPTYEFRCLDCKKRFEIYIPFAEYGKKEVSCTHCQSKNVRRKIGRIRVARSSESRLEDMANPENLDALEDDPKALGRMMRQMSAEVGEDMGPEFNEVVRRLESGQSPEEIERDLPDMGLDDTPMGPELDDF